MPRILTALFIALLLVPTAALASDDDDDATLLSLTASAEREVDNDLMTVNLSIERRSADVSVAVEEVNTLMRQALDRAKREPAAEVRSLGYSTSPVYDRERKQVEPVAWQVTQVLELKGKDFEKLTALAGDLQQTGLAITQIQFSVSPEAQAGYRDELLDEAIVRWQRIAQRMGASLGASHLFPKEMTLHENGGFYPSPMLRSAVMESALASAPALEAGRSTVRVTVSGQARAFGVPMLRTQEGR
jgi:predicted secreted protein